MIDHKTGGNRVVLGDPVPWFSAPIVTGGSFDLHVSAGRWVVLSFLGSPANPRAMAEIAELARASSSLGEDHVIVGCVFTGQPDDMASLAAISSNKLFFLADHDGAISRSFGAHEMPRTVVLDPMLRAVADIAWDMPQGHAETVGNVLRGLPSVDDSAGVPMFAPALMVPRVFSFEICDFLVQFYEQQGGVDSGFQFDVAGKTATLSDWRLKRPATSRWPHPRSANSCAARSCAGCCPQSSNFFSFARREWIVTSSPVTTARSAVTSIVIAITSMPAPSIAASRSRSISTIVSKAAT